MLNDTKTCKPISIKQRLHNLTIKKKKKKSKENINCKKLKKKKLKKQKRHFKLS